MAKAGMRRPDPKEPHGTESNHKTHIPKNDVSPVPEIQGKAKAGHKKAKPMWGFAFSCNLMYFVDKVQICFSTL